MTGLSSTFPAAFKFSASPVTPAFVSSSSDTSSFVASASAFTASVSTPPSLSGACSASCSSALTVNVINAATFPITSAAAMRLIISLFSVLILFSPPPSSLEQQRSISHNSTPLILYVKTLLHATPRRSHYFYSTFTKTPCTTIRSVVPPAPEQVLNVTISGRCEKSKG